MSVRREISNQIRYLIISNCRNQLSYRAIAKKFGVYLVHKTVENLSDSGRKRCTTAEENRRIIRKCRQNPRITSQNIVETLESNVSSKIVDVGCRSWD